MFPEERQQKIYDIICERKSVKVSEISTMMNISEVTVRRDLEELQNQDKILRTHGGAISKYSVANEISAPELISSHKCMAEKQAISALAYRHINDKDTILIDSSSTVYELVKLIAAGDKKNLLIITNSLLTINLLASRSDFKVIMVGGEINYKHNNVEGYLTNETIKNLRADKGFIGINGIDPRFGYSTPRFEDAEGKTLILNSSIQSFILADNTKFDKTYLARVNAECDFIISDKRLPGCDYDWLAAKTNLIFANEDS